MTCKDFIKEYIKDYYEDITEEQLERVSKKICDCDEFWEELDNMIEPFLQEQEEYSYVEYEVKIGDREKTYGVYEVWDSWCFDTLEEAVEFWNSIELEKDNVEFKWIQKNYYNEEDEIVDSEDVDEYLMELE